MIDETEKKAQQAVEALANKMQDALNNMVLRKLNKAWEQDE